MNRITARKTEIWVGLFILLSMLALFAMVIFMASERKLFAERIEILGVFDDVQGLRVGGPVMLSGLQCGTVNSIKFTSDGRLMVTMHIQKEFQEQLREDSMATIGTIGLLGDKSVNITAGSRDRRVVGEGHVLDTLPSMTFSEILKEARPVVDALGETFANLRNITAKLGETEGDLKGAMSEIRTLLERINRGEGSLGRFITEDAAYRTALRSLEEIQTFVEQINSPRGTLGRLVRERVLYDSTLETIKDIGQTADTIKDLAGDAKPVLKNGQQVMVEGKKALLKLQDILQRVDRVARSLEASSGHLPDLVTEADQVLGDIRAAVRDAQEVIRAAQSHWLIRPYISEPEPVTVIHESR